MPVELEKIPVIELVRHIKIMLHVYVSHLGIKSALGE